ncbi:MAG: hypothetical protein O2968_20035 [Acidobacteria bacterium]|nr:hypothetical protein [Acidobacteriota bacterium]
MSRPDHKITDRQLRVYSGLQKILMAWVALIAVIVLFSGVLIALLWSLFMVEGESVTKIILAVIDGTLGLAFKAVYTHLFPPITPSDAPRTGSG